MYTCFETSINNTWCIVSSDLENWDVEHRKALLRVYERPYAHKILEDWKNFAREELYRPWHYRNFFKDLKRCQHPILYIHGARDILVSPKEAPKFLEMTQNAR